MNSNLPALLVVDDEEGPRVSVRTVFASEYRVFTASSAEEGFSRLKDEMDIGVAILDIQMAGRTGIELLEDIKSVRPDVEVIMLTAFETLDSARAAMRLGACDYQTKPFDVPTMRRAVRRAVELRNKSAVRARAQDLLGELSSSKELAAMLAELNEIYAGAIHDINNPLTVVVGTMDLLREQIDGRMSLTGREFEIFKGRFQHVLRILDNLVEVSSRSARLLKGAEVEVNEGNPFNATNLALEIAESHPRGRGHEVRFDVATVQCVAKANESDLSQAVLNLILNAFQSGSFGVRVWIKAWCQPGGEIFPNWGYGQPGELGSPLIDYRQREFATISVTDTGKGIPSADLLKVFEPHFTTKGNDGSGMGLAVVSKVVLAADGCIKIISSAHGTEIRLHLPITRA